MDKLSPPQWNTGGGGGGGRLQTSQDGCPKDVCPRGAAGHLGGGQEAPISRTKPPRHLPFPPAPCSSSLRYFSYAVLLGPEPSLKNTSNGVGRDRHCSTAPPSTLGAPPAAREGRAMLGLILTPPASKTTLPHLSRAKGRGPLSRNAPASPLGVYSGTWLVPGCASDGAAALCGRNLYLWPE